MDELAIQLGDCAIVGSVLPNGNLRLYITVTYPAPDGTHRLAATNTLIIEMRIDTNPRPSDGNVSNVVAPEWSSLMESTSLRITKYKDNFTQREFWVGVAIGFAVVGVVFAVPAASALGSTAIINAIDNSQQIIEKIPK
ncbi:MAG: hypothetical protein ACRC41_09775 [Sarcina sp.]